MFDGSEDWRIVTRAELRRRGMTAYALKQHIVAGGFVPMGRGVVLIGARCSGVEGWWQEIAALAALHPTGCLWAGTAAAVHGLDGFDPPTPHRVRVPRSAGRKAPHLVTGQLHRPPVDVAGLAVASAADTLLNLGDGLAPRPGCAAARTHVSPTELVELAVECALRRELTSMAELREIVAATTNRTSGRRELAAVLEARGDLPPTGSYLETRCHQVLRSAGLPTFNRQVELHDQDGRIGWVDFEWHGVVIEAVGERWHLDRFTADHRRYARLTAAGYRLLPFTFEDIEHRPHHVVAAVTAACRAAA